MRESVYQGKLIKKIKRLLPGCIVIKNDPQYTQGITDLLILHGKNWGALEVKASATAPSQPNQGYYVDKMDEMSFAAFIFPENEEEVLHDLQLALEA